MSNSSIYVRPQTHELARRLQEPRRVIQVVAGPRQVGKMTLAGQAANQSGLPTRYASADEPTLRNTQWIEQQWEAARSLTDEADIGGALLVLDEVQKVTGWSETVKYLWDADTRAGRARSALFTTKSYWNGTCKSTCTTPSTGSTRTFPRKRWTMPTASSSTRLERRWKPATGLSIAWSGRPNDKVPR